MTKTILVTLDEGVTFPDTEMDKAAVVTIGSTAYNGKVKGVITHSIDSVGTVTIEGPGLKVKTSVASPAPPPS